MACPLSKADLTQLRKSIALLRELEQDIALAVAANVPDIDEIVARQAHLKQALSQLYETYEPEIRKQQSQSA